MGELREDTPLIIYWAGGWQGEHIRNILGKVITKHREAYERVWRICLCILIMLGEKERRSKGQWHSFLLLRSISLIDKGEINPKMYDLNSEEAQKRSG